MTESRNAAIIGTGMIASSLAVLCTGHGFWTMVLSRSPESSERCRKSYDDAYEQMIRKGILTREQAEICRSYLTIMEDYAELAPAEIAFECITEDVEKKHEVYRQLEKNCGRLRAICSVSSSIIPDRLAEGMEIYGDRILVAHPFNPVHMVPYFEICVSGKTGDGVADYVVDVLKELDRKPVVLKKATPGFIGNRLQFALLREALQLIESGIADPEDIDACLNYSFCPRYTSIGMFEHFDNGGLELCSTVCRNLFPILGSAKEVPELLQEMISRGDLGVPSGQGFYNWENTDMDAYRERVSEPYWKFCSWNYPKRKREE